MIFGVKEALRPSGVIPPQRSAWYLNWRRGRILSDEEQTLGSAYRPFRPNSSATPYW
jgi:hypothetical protein